LRMKVDGFLLDNFTPNLTRQAVSIIRAVEGGQNIFIEASGGITEKNFLSYIKTGIDAISVGAMTHSAISKDIRLEFTS